MAQVLAQVALLSPLASIVQTSTMNVIEQHLEYVSTTKPLLSKEDFNSVCEKAKAFRESEREREREEKQDRYMSTHPQFNWHFVKRNPWLPFISNCVNPPVVPPV